MLIGIFADSHDHLDNIRQAVSLFNESNCELVVFAGDLVSSFAVPPLRALRCKVIGCFGDNEGNKPGVTAGMRIIGTIGEPPFGFKTPDGCRILVTHMDRMLRGLEGDFDVAIYAHTHKPNITHDAAGRLFINPGETSGWSYGRPSVALLETSTKQAWIVDLQPFSPPLQPSPRQATSPKPRTERS
ncbi:metallophosphoesterase [Schlesneria paludicola]|uniref:metallophosphoesterase n=1 Tax=Schlesneria paludicola TaxID=360056 RepID=UPI00029A17D4|nr:metallophosphoesterase [Schlesneria paludicola]